MVFFWGVCVFEKGKNWGGLMYCEKEKEGVIDERKKEKKG
ncbi:hypothetical protein GCM10010495_81670 [Kitasatospora herbaricolor]|nr:hypothetical protein GCM10010252_77850 [Streptomyces aureoverticillatus]GGV51874.1 hypothetical protein GCM10010495_81670 [Kitasatospora herbaricolor]